MFRYKNRKWIFCLFDILIHAYYKHFYEKDWILTVWSLHTCSTKLARTTLKAWINECFCKFNGNIEWTKCSSWILINSNNSNHFHYHSFYFFNNKAFRYDTSNFVISIVINRENRQIHFDNVSEINSLCSIDLYPNESSTKIFLNVHGYCLYCRDFIGIFEGQGHQSLWHVFQNE